MPVSSLSRGLIDKSHKSRKARIMRNGKIGNQFLVLALVLSFVLMPAAASADVELTTVSAATVTVAPTTASAAAKYTVVFTTYAFLASTETIIIEFPVGTTVAGYDGLVTVNGTAVTGCGIASQKATLDLSADVPAGTVTVVLDKDGTNDIGNPTADDYKVKVSTSIEMTPMESNAYTITAPPPTVDKVGPPAANRGETLDLYIVGDDFDTGAGATTVSLSGTGITVDDVGVWDTSHLTATITIASGADATVRDVTVTTTAGSSDGTDKFTVNAAGTALVDGYETIGVEALDWLDYQGSTAAIDAAVDASDGVTDTLLVHAATYNETVNITKTLVVKSYMGAASTILVPTSASDGFAVTADNVTVDGFTVKDTRDQKSAILVTGAGAKLKNNVMLTTLADPGYPFGLLLGGASAEVSGNELDMHHTMIVQFNATDAWLSKNSFGAGINLQAGVSGVDVVDNEIIGSELWGIVFEKPAAPDTFTDIMIDGNVISGTTQSATETEGQGILVKSGIALASPITIQNNQIGANEGPGIEISSGVTGVGDVVINYNDIVGNGGYGIKNGSTADVDAKYNWWGAVGGPSDDPNAAADADPVALGTGDAVTAKVVYDPWLTKDIATVAADGVKWYGSGLALDAAGWNTLAVPVNLYDAGDTFGELDAMGSFLGDYLTGYWYDADASVTPPHWVLNTTGTSLVPGRGFYVKTSKAISVPVLYNGDMGPMPSYGMYAGWNLIGSMFGIDKAGSDADYGVEAIADGEDKMKMGIALSSVGASASVVVSPGLPGQEGTPWSEVYTSTISANDMYVGEGYWVFMTADGTLAGFEVTPFYR